MTSATSLLASDAPTLAFVESFAPLLAWAPDIAPPAQASPIPPLAILVLGAAAILLVIFRASRREPRPNQAQPATPAHASPQPALQQPSSLRLASRAVVGIAAGFALLLVSLVVTCAIVGDDGLIRFSGGAYTVGGEPYVGSVTAEGFPSWSYAISVLLGLIALGVAVFVAVRRGQAWLATIIAHVSVGAALTMAAMAAAGPITELTMVSSHSPDPPSWTAVGPALMAAAYIVFAITVAVSTFALLRRRPAVMHQPG